MMDRLCPYIGAYLIELSLLGNSVGEGLIDLDWWVLIVGR
ncbi:MAG: hypothetical protein ACI92G_000350 [Candidatus Pelagisphaera sp.]|jgi:hypothetical protein